jgi:4-hydroxy-tetrahydrodipicolinate synthase
MALDDRASFGNAVVPMDDAGEQINEVEFRRMLRYMSQGGTSVFVGGPHATEFVNMDRVERRRLWEVSVDELNGKGPVNAIPFGPASTTEMISMFRLAKEMGFDGAQLYPGAQEGRGGDGLYVAEAERYYRDVLEAVDLPLYLCGYHGGEIIDAPNGRVPFDLLLRLVDDYPHIAGITIFGDEPDDVIRGFTKELDGRQRVRCAGAIDWYQRMECGIHGFHSIQQSIAPRLCSTMIDAYHCGDRERARQLSDTLARLNRIVHQPSYAYPRTIKPILNSLGFRMGIIRRPYLPPSAETQEEMARRVAELDLARFEHFAGDAV